MDPKRLLVNNSSGSRVGMVFAKEHDTQGESMCVCWGGGLGSRMGSP